MPSAGSGLDPEECAVIGLFYHDASPEMAIWTSNGGTPRSARSALNTAEAVRLGILWLVNGPASFQSEPVPAGVLTPGAQLRAPMLPMPIDRL
jgi:hypothetical protein